MMPMVSLDWMCRSMPSSAMPPAFLEYLKLTRSKSMEPSATSKTGFSGLTSVLSSSSTSAMRLPDSAAMTMVTNTMETIIRLLSIMKL